MARSIHTTRAELERERAWRWSDPAQREKRLRQVSRALAAKRCIKEEVRRERALGAAAVPAAFIAPDTLPIRVVDHGRLIHYPATEADLRAILRAFPPGTLDGITAIEFALGKETQRATARRADIGSDPTGRRAIERLPGVFEGICLGIYSRGYARIRLFAYVHEPELPGGELFEPYLKLRMLSTLVHEVAHHVDLRTRVARGRWRADDEDKLEGYAEEREREWVQELVVPYLVRAYPQALAGLDRWLLEHAGAVVPFGTLAGDPCGILDLSSAFEELVHAWHAGKPLGEARLELASALQGHGEDYTLSHRVLDAVLTDEPQHFAALTLRAEILELEQRLDEAEAIVRGLLARDERSLNAWQVLVHIERRRRAWRGVFAAASRVVELAEPGSWERLFSLGDRARALLELGEYGALEADVAVLLAEGGRYDRNRALGLRAISLLRAGRLAEALAAANEGLVEAQGSDWRHELLAVRFEASRLLHPSLPPEPLLPATLAALRRRDHDDWVERLCRPA